MILYYETLFAVGLSPNPTALDLVVFSLTGMLVVLLSLTLLAVSCVVISYLLRLFSLRPLPSRAASTSEADLAEETVAVIAAAVAETIDMPHRIVHIRGLTPEHLNWPLEGRLQHHASHTPKHRH